MALRQLSFSRRCSLLPVCSPFVLSHSPPSLAVRDDLLGSTLTFVPFAFVRPAASSVSAAPTPHFAQRLLP
ncbi:hypothetical protein EXIGLDRAFT_729073 [Exidia glandulosa HHB12029]|uniref:Uncharacterized protein n=1 Tax=Exidia glandulosa HHB12029 TaxID=1314781 RepID=A0A165ZIB6_EXIGL|nr:hypothetical protein EXIGLDRAFT_729073 [Exidia glandulosa HHB12029]